MSQQLPADLEGRCEEILSLENQGVPLTRADYLLFGLVTVIVPLILIVIGVSI